MAKYVGKKVLTDAAKNKFAEEVRAPTPSKSHLTALVERRRSKNELTYYFACIGSLL
jgi:hypothetical protein